MQENIETVEKRFPRPAIVLPCLILFAAAMASYGNIYGNGFVFDDERLITGNAFLRGGHSLLAMLTMPTNSGSGTMSDFYRPLQLLIYYVIYQIGGADPLGFHLLNAGLHAANAALVYVFGRRLKFHPVAVFLAALIWAAHPIHTEAVAYMSGTADPLFVFFTLSGLIILLPDFTRRRIAGACACFILALLSKEAAVVFPALAAATLFLASDKRMQIKTYLPTLPLWLIAAGYIALHLTVLNFQAADINFDHNAHAHLYATHVMARIYTCLATLPFYLILLLYPVGLHLERQFPVYNSPQYFEIVGGTIMVLAALAQLIWARGRRALPLSWALLWAAASMAPQTGILMPVNALFLEHWMYLPTIGLFLGIAQTVAMQGGIGWHRAQQVLTVFALGLALVFGIMTFNQNEVWRDAFTLYPDILRHEKSVRALANLGKAYMERGEYEQSLQYYYAAQQITDQLPELHQNIAATLSRMPGWQQHPEDIIAHLKRAAELDPQFLPAFDGLVYVYGALGDEAQQAIYKAKADALREKFMPKN